VRTAGNEAVTVVEVDGRVYSPTFLRGSTVSRTDNLLPLGVLSALMEQPGGLLLGIDIVCAGYRVRPGTGYPRVPPSFYAAASAILVRLDDYCSHRVGLMAIDATSLKRIDDTCGTQRAQRWVRTAVVVSAAI
jgi:hypothetical protein